MSPLFDDYSLELLNDTIFLYQVHIQFKNRVLGVILPLLWQDDFFSITQSNQEFSFFLSSKHDHTISSQLNIVQKMEQEYKVLKLYQVNHQIDELGVVAQFASTFQKMDIPILYINSFASNFILIPIDEIPKLDGMIEF